jgi:hypothetical protein
VLFLTQKLILSVQPGDRFEISIVKTATGETALGIAGLKSKQYRKAIVGEGSCASPKSVSQSRLGRTPTSASSPAHSRKRLK